MCNVNFRLRGVYLGYKNTSVFKVIEGNLHRCRNGKINLLRLKAFTGKREINVKAYRIRERFKISGYPMGR
jgi:hypothetical protein